MIITFRQGIITGQISQNFIQLVNGKVNINVDVQRLDMAFAYGSMDYLFTESENIVGAWGPFTNNTNTYLYWDIDLSTGIRTFGTSKYALTFGAVLPTSPNIDQHFFDYNDNKMKVWDGKRWNEKLRVFAGYVQGGAVLNSQSFGSQVNLNAQISLGYILYDSNRNPLKISDKTGRSVFVTTESSIYTQNDIHNAYKIDAVLMDGKALEPIPAFHCITWKGPKQIGVASYVDYTRPCIGVSVEKSGKDDVKQFITKGFVTNYNNWNFTAAPNTPLFVGSTGEITTTVPQQYSLQKIGHVVSPDTIFVDLQEIILIENIVTVPSPTPTITPTSTLTPTATRSPTPTATSSATPSPTPSVTATVTQTPVPTVTPSVTRSIMPSISTTTTVTPTLTATPQATITPTPTPSVTASAVPVSGDSDVLVLLYAGLDDADPRLALSVLSDSTVRTDISDFSVNWPQIQSATLLQSLTENASVGNKITRKIRVGDLGASGNFISVNAPDSFTPTFNGYDRSLFKSGSFSNGAFNQYSGGTSQMQPYIDRIANSPEGVLALTSYAVDTFTNLQYGIIKYEALENIDELLMFYNGTQLTVTVTNPEIFQSYQLIGIAGVDTLPNGKAFMLGMDNGYMAVFVIDVTNLDTTALTVTVTYRKLSSGVAPTNGLFHDADNFSYNADVYEIKASGSRYYISGVSRSFASRQSILDGCSDKNYQQLYSFVIAYNVDTDDTDAVYFGTTYDYGYVSVTDDYAFKIDPDLSTAPGNGSILNVYALGNGEALLKTNQYFNSVSPPGYDLRLRTVKQNDGSINIYTFGGGTYRYIPTQNIIYTSNVNEMYADMPVISITDSGNSACPDAYNNIVIDTWAGKLGTPFVITPSATPQPSPTPTLTPAPVQANSYDPVILADSPTSYWSFNSNSNDDISGSPLTLNGVTSLVRDVYGNTLQINGANSGASISNTISLSSNFSMEAWIKPSSFSGYGTIFGDSRDGYYGLQFDSTGTLYLYVQNFNTVLIPTGTFVIGNTYHIVVTVDSDRNITTYVNSSKTGGTDLYPSDNVLTVGFIGTDADGETFYGNIGNPALYLNTVLTQTQVTAHYNAGITGYKYPL